MAVEINPHIDGAAIRDIKDLENKIGKFRAGEISDERFRAFRLARGVYGQRQSGVQMIRIKLPYGKITADQLRKISEVSDRFSTGVLHLTTRQDIQIHYVKLEDTPQVWAILEEEAITLREACGNTVRNVTASPSAGVDPKEPFDVTPYAHAFFSYFLRNPICQEMGRKFKVSFSSSDDDTALSYMHDLGFIPKIKEGKRGFKVMLAGGLGAQPYLAETAFEFLEADRLIPFSEAVLRVFDRYGERTRRHKARMKYLMQDIGLEAFMKLTEEETPALKNKIFPIDTTEYPSGSNFPSKPEIQAKPSDVTAFEKWKKSNVKPQKQDGSFSVNIRVHIGNITTDTARAFAELVDEVAADDIRVTINQGLFIKFIPEGSLAYVFNRLTELGLALPGADSTMDITTCPGTDTCNLGISSSYGITSVLEKLLAEEYPELIYNQDIKIKISGCMNACGQHSMANIGLHGSSIKHGDLVMPAMQLLLGGGTLGDGAGTISDKVIKLPTKRMPDALRALLNDYENEAGEGEYYNQYYGRKGKNYFYQLLKPFAEVKEPGREMFIDWGHEELFTTEVGVGECAGVIMDLVGTLLQETEDKLVWAQESLANKQWPEAIYHSYNVLIGTAKALLTSKEIGCNTQHGIIQEFDKHFVQEGLFDFGGDFKSAVLEINKNEPTESFAMQYFQLADSFINSAKAYRNTKEVQKVASSLSLAV